MMGRIERTEECVDRERREKERKGRKGESMAHKAFPCVTHTLNI